MRGGERKEWWCAERKRERERTEGERGRRESSMHACGLSEND